MSAEPPPPDDPRTAQLAANLAAVRARIAAAAKAAGRDPAGVTLIAVTKTYPAADVIRLARLGVTDLGENRDQEAAPKAAEVAAAGVTVRWHFVGRLQRNKCRSVARYAELVHSVDSVRLATALGNAASHRDRPLPVLVQVSVDADPNRGGAPPDQVLRVADAIAAEPSLRLRGVMTVAPLSWPADRAFEVLADLAARLRADHPEATIVSAGMSGDLEPALAHGATHVRIGTALLGERDSLR
ncbi:MAG TPA: YggS family pyridoxal phosphate-dependent enzyme [Natronosporangium sp.]